jgi:biotin carboxyl carrier protein
MSAVKVERDVYSVLNGTRQTEARVEVQGGETVVTVRGRSLRIRLEDPREWSGAALSANGGGRARVASPMPGKIVRVLVAVGDTVEAGQGLVVVEAMKMQNEMKSPITGTVRQVSCEAGAAVTANQVLVVVEADAG